MSTATDSQPGVSVRLRQIRREFAGGVVAVESIDIEVPPGQFFAMLGPSGCGKSTLLRIIAGLDRPDTGSVETDRRRIAYVFQDAHLLPWRTVLDNVALPLELRGETRAARRESALRAIDRVGLREAVLRYPAQLSGGMRMRASLARALVVSPRLLLLDEPFAALDEITRHQLDEQLRTLWAQSGMTVIFVTHSIPEAAFLAQRAVVLTRRPARIVLDHSLTLPELRTNALRGEAQFAHETGVLFSALQRGGAY
ncbi:MAG: ABC transporter ATP-binding protein [Tepidisphaeraceae bacterium]